MAMGGIQKALVEQLGAIKDKYDIEDFRKMGYDNACTLT